MRKFSVLGLGLILLSSQLAFAIDPEAVERRLEAKDRLAAQEKAQKLAACESKTVATTQKGCAGDYAILKELQDEFARLKNDKNLFSVKEPCPIIRASKIFSTSNEWVNGLSHQQSRSCLYELVQLKLEEACHNVNDTTVAKIAFVYSFLNDYINKLHAHPYCIAARGNKPIGDRYFKELPPDGIPKISEMPDLKQLPKDTPTKKSDQPAGAAEKVVR